MGLVIADCNGIAGIADSNGIMGIAEKQWDYGDYS